MNMVNRTVARLYDTYQDAAEAVRDLEVSGIPGDDISLIASKVDDRVVHAEESGNEAAPGAEVGAGLGAVAGGGAGVLAGLGMLAIPGIGPVIAAGWLVALAAGAVGGAVAGGMIGGLIGAGIGKETAEVYAEGVRRGGTLVSARVPEEDAAAVEAILGRHHPVDPAARRAMYADAGQTGYDIDTPTDTIDDIRRERAGQL